MRKLYEKLFFFGSVVLEQRSFYNVFYLELKQTSCVAV